MKIKSIKINNFRSIKDSTISGPLNDVWTLVGQNNAGKSSVMHMGYGSRAPQAGFDLENTRYPVGDSTESPD